MLPPGVCGTNLPKVPCRAPQGMLYWLDGSLCGSTFQAFPFEVIKMYIILWYCTFSSVSCHTFRLYHNSSSVLYTLPQNCDIIHVNSSILFFVLLWIMNEFMNFEGKRFRWLILVFVFTFLVTFVCSLFLHFVLICSIIFISMLLYLLFAVFI